MTTLGQRSAQVGQCQKLNPSVAVETRTASASKQQTNGLANSPIGVPQNLPLELASVIAAWPTLPEHIKAAITALVGTAVAAKEAK